MPYRIGLVHGNEPGTCYRSEKAGTLSIEPELAGQLREAFGVRGIPALWGRSYH